MSCEVTQECLAVVTFVYKHVGVASVVTSSLMKE